MQVLYDVIYWGSLATVTQFSHVVPRAALSPCWLLLHSPTGNPLLLHQHSLSINMSTSACQGKPLIQTVSQSSDHQLGPRTGDGTVSPITSSSCAAGTHGTDARRDAIVDLHVNPSTRRQPTAADRYGSRSFCVRRQTRARVGGCE